MQEFIVSNLEDENDGDFSEGDLSLREAIANSDNGDKITFDESLSGGTIFLTQRELRIDKSIEIEGLGATRLTIDAGGEANTDNSRVFNIDDRTRNNFAYFRDGSQEILDVGISGLTITGGKIDSFEGNFSNSGGGIFNAENLTIADSIITGNSTFGSGGGVYNQGTLTVNDSTVNNNAITGNGSPTPDGGGLYNSGTLFVNNSTVANNIGTDGGGIVNGRPLYDDENMTRLRSETTITNSTITGNSGNNTTSKGYVIDRSGSGLSNYGTEITVTSSIIANNQTDISIESSNPNRENLGVTSGGNNLIGNVGDYDGAIDSDLVGTTDNSLDPLLGELQDNGGTTSTIALQSGSPAIDAGTNPNGLATDRRGAGFDRTVGSGTDIGAFEVQEDNNGDNMNEELVVSILEDENDGDNSAGDLSLREAIAIAESGNTITFDSTLSGGTITLALGELAIDKSLTIQGLGAENIIIDANANSRVFNIDDGNEDTQIDVALNSLAITGSRVEYEGDIDLLYNGGGILNSENLEVNDADIYNNQTILEGGGIYSNGTLTVNNSEIFNNSVGDDRDRTTAGGGIYADGTLIVNNSAIYNNSGSGGFGIAVGGGIVSAGTATINQSTITGNRAEGRLNTAGGIENREGDLAITSSTISNNFSNLTGGIVNNSEGEVTVTSTIISNIGNQNITGNNFVSGGNNFISGEAVVGSRGGPRTISAEGFTNGENGDVVGTLENPIDPLLGELLGNGGITPTQALLESSPAIDAGSNPNNLETDQRGEGFDRTVGESTDIGAFELQNGSILEPDALVVSTLEDENDGDFSEGDLSLREAIANAESNNTITFDSSLSGGTISLSLGELVVNQSLTIQGLGAENIIIDGSGNNNRRIFNIDDGNADLQSEVAIDGLTIAGASTSIGENVSSAQAIGAGIFNRENLEIDNAIVRDNSANGDGGGIYSEGTLTVNNSAIYNNSAQIGFGGRGGGILNAGQATVNQSTIANNNVNGRSTGGGIENTGTLDITNSTVSGNTDGISNTGGEVTLTSTIVAGNTGNDDLQGDDLISGGNNLIGGETISSLDIGNAGDLANIKDSDLIGTADNPIDPLLGELQDNGGSTPTFALSEGSQAIDAGSNPNNLATDQRGSEFDRTVGNGTDIGAFEVQDAGNNQLEQPDVRVPDVQVPVIETPQPGKVTNDSLEGTDDNDNLSGEGTNDDTISGGAGHDTLNGNDGHDNISGGTGDDLIFGGAGDDLLDGNDGHNTISGDNGHDTLFGGEGNETLTGGDGNDLLVGAAGHDSLVGSKGHDVINGEAGDDFINGDEGDDLLTGGAGGDILVGGAGHDVFVLESFDSHDTITDFELGADRLQLSESLTLGQLNIVDNESNTGSLILDSNNHDAIIASVDNIHAADLEIHLFC